MAKPKLLASQLVFEGFFHVKNDTLERDDGIKTSYTHMHVLWDAVIVLALTPEGKYILNREYRHPTATVLLGCPGGKLDPGEEPLQGAQRELFEETGYWADTLISIGAAFQMPALCNQKIHYFYAPKAILKGAQKLDPFEYIQTELADEAEIKQEIARGAILDSHLLTALSLRRLYER
jgi:ADP-ribose pyrophosphatase